MNSSWLTRPAVGRRHDCVLQSNITPRITGALSCRVRESGFDKIGLISQLSGSRHHEYELALSLAPIYSTPPLLYSPALTILAVQTTQKVQNRQLQARILTISVLFNILNLEQPSSRIQTISHQYVFLHVQQQQ